MLVNPDRVKVELVEEVWKLGGVIKMFEVEDIKDKVNAIKIGNAKRNTSYKIVVESPLLRPGIKIESSPVSEGYLVEETKKLLKFVREINSGE